MKAFECLDDVMSFDELKEIHETLVRRELRFHISISEILKQRATS
jgi:hypothetical protein